MNYQVGQRVWVAFDPRLGYREPRWATVTKVGRRWVWLDNDRWRVAVGDVHLDGGAGTSPGRVWASQEEHAAWVELSTAWDNLCREVRLARPSIPKGVTAADVARARELLRV